MLAEAKGAETGHSLQGRGYLRVVIEADIQSDIQRDRPRGVKLILATTCKTDSSDEFSIGPICKVSCWSVFAIRPGQGKIHIRL